MKQSVLSRLVSLLAVFALAACAPRFDPPPGYQGGFGDAGLYGSTGTPATITVETGDTVYAISQRYGVPMRQIIERNGLSPPYMLRPGQRLRLIIPETYVVRRGDTLSEIADFYRVDLVDMVRLNNLSSPDRIAIGQKLRIPTAPSANSRMAEAPRASRERARPTRSNRRSAPELPPPPPRTSGKFLWPAEGRVIARFGWAGKGLRNDGINIRVREGVPVRAADAGVVAYSGNELRGFGNLLLIKHGDGFTTAYAHNSQLLVQRGDQVTRGQTIARAGSTGNVAEPQVHFEVRRGSTALDPLKYLPAPQS